MDPDVVVVQRDVAGHMHVAERRSGDKQHRIVLSGTSGRELGNLKYALVGSVLNAVSPSRPPEHGGVREEAVHDASAVCLSDAQALLLARAGARLERAFGGARDVEWAFADGRLHLLQSRPVTALFNWTEFELKHELDGPCGSDDDVWSVANTG